MSLDPVRAVEAVWRIESPRLIAGLARITRDVGVAEDLAQDALLIALEKWPLSGVPDNPGAWLMTTARRRALDVVRRDQMLERKHAQLAHELNASQDDTAALHEALDDAIGDDLLRLIYTCCHPVLSTEARVALTLRMLGGLTTEEIARAFLLPTATIAQRIVRAKRTLTEARVPFEVPAASELVERTASVLEVIYLIFNEGYAATSGDKWLRPELCEEALRLGRILAGLAPNDAEVHGLIALMELQASRLRTRVTPTGDAIPLFEQDRARWDQLLIRRGLAALERAQSLRSGALGPYTLQAAIAACHARARTNEETDWPGIAALYDALGQVTRSPVVELNRAIAVGYAFGPDEALEILDGLNREPALQRYHLLAAARAEMLEKAGRLKEARSEFERAAEMTRNEPEQRVLRARANALVVNLL